MLHNPDQMIISLHGAYLNSILNTLQREREMVSEFTKWQSSVLVDTLALLGRKCLCREVQTRAFAAGSERETADQCDNMSTFAMCVYVVGIRQGTAMSEGVKT